MNANRMKNPSSKHKKIQCNTYYLTRLTYILMHVLFLIANMIYGTDLFIDNPVPQSNLLTVVYYFHIDFHSPTFLLSPPDHFGFLADPHFQIAIANYLRQPCLVMAPVVGRCFGKNGVVLDRYGANLA